MRYDFYSLVAGEFGKPELNLFKSASVEAWRENAMELVSNRFRELVSSNPEIGSLIVIQATDSDPPGNIVAAEFIHAMPVEFRERQGKPARELKWLMDASTGLVGAH